MAADQTLGNTDWIRKALPNLLHSAPVPGCEVLWARGLGGLGSRGWLREVCRDSVQLAPDSSNTGREGLEILHGHVDPLSLAGKGLVNKSVSAGSRLARSFC